jgi:putative DNA methylase
MSAPVVPLSLKGTPALIERLLPVQKLSVEAYKEQMAGSGKTLTALGSYWKGRKPLILSKACILGCLLPATDTPEKDLKIFEMLMAMDDESFVARWKRRPGPKEILERVSIARVADYFTVLPKTIQITSAPVDWSDPQFEDAAVNWRDDLTERDRRQLEAQMLPQVPYRQRVDKARRPEEVIENVNDHIWDEVNAHLRTNARSLPEVVEQLGVMRFGHRPRMADTFCGSGQIPFEAARLGCDVYASDLNPIACMLTWGAFHVAGGTKEDRAQLKLDQRDLVSEVQAEVDKLQVELDGSGWRAKTFLYCAEARCPQTGWMVPLLPTLIISKQRTADRNNVIAVLVPNESAKRYEIAIESGVTDEEAEGAARGTIGREGRFGDAYLIHRLNGVDYKTNISTLRGDYETPGGTIGNRVRRWDIQDIRPRSDDIFQERLYCIQWVRSKPGTKTEEYEFRSVTAKDLQREEIVYDYLSSHLQQWQSLGWLPTMRIEPGGPPRYEGLSMIRGRGWTYWHHLFTPRQLLLAGLVNRSKKPGLKFGLAQLINWNSRLSSWNPGSGGGGSVAQTFYNQALNTLYNYGCRSTWSAAQLIEQMPPWFPIPSESKCIVECVPADQIKIAAQFFITDPPYGDAVRYEEILGFFIAWLRKNPPPEFAEWTWDSRRALAIKGEGEDFRRGMVAAYRRMAECMPEDGIQVVMFTHQSGAIWADMANIVWAAGMHVTAAWYVVTETDSALREGSYVKGTVLLVLRKSQGWNKTTRDDLAWEIQEEVERQVTDLIGLNQQAKGLYRDENVFEDADVQMAGYAAALRVLTRYAMIDGRDMTAEAIRPRVKGETTFVDSLIAFAVDTANRCLVPQGFAKRHWEKLSGVERFYLKMLDMESRGAKTLDNYQNFAKAFKVRDFKPVLASHKANEARLKSAVEFGRSEMSEGSELYESTLRAVLYAIMELQKDTDGAETLAHLTLNVPNYYSDMTQRELVVELADYLQKRLDALRPADASAARVLRELVSNQRLG